MTIFGRQILQVCSDSGYAWFAWTGDVCFHEYAWKAAHAKCHPALGESLSSSVATKTMCKPRFMVKLVFKAHGETSFQRTQTWSCATSSSSSLLATSQSQDTLRTLSTICHNFFWLIPCISPLTFSLCVHLPRSFILPQTHGHFASSMLKLNLWPTLFLLLCSEAVEFSPFPHLSHSVLPCLQTCIKDTSTSLSLIHISEPTRPP